jgi:hypothetical protein
MSGTPGAHLTTAPHVTTFPLRRGRPGPPRSNLVPYAIITIPPRESGDPGFLVFSAAWPGFGSSDSATKNTWVPAFAGMSGYSGMASR